MQKKSGLFCIFLQMAVQLGQQVVVTYCKVISQYTVKIAPAKYILVPHSIFVYRINKLAKLRKIAIFKLCYLIPSDDRIATIW